MMISRCFCQRVVITLLFALAAQSQAEPNATDMQPDPIVKAWGILFQVMQRFEEYVAKKALSSIHNDDMLSASAISMLRNENKKTPPVQSEADSALLAFTREVAALHAAGDAFDQSGAETELDKVRTAFANMQNFIAARRWKPHGIWQTDFAARCIRRWS